ncbi:MAG: fatty acid kinase, partial [Gaiellaceae bacterium]|nr:fatty acid kinase [Gaiellaceae bacterium]
MSDPSLVRFRVAVHGALAHLESRRQEINDLNVFPVADGDTGDNMALTLKAVVAELDRLAADDDRSIDEIGRDEIVETVARAALLGARGNSGVILSQLIRGAAEELVSRPGELVDPVLVGAAFARAAQRAYASVREPVEGTILTVAREMGTDMSSLVAHLPDAERRLPVTGDAQLQNHLIANLLESALATGEQSLKRGPELLPILRQAGVVDAGAYGLLVVLSGVLAVLRGEGAPELEHHAPARISHPQHASSTFRYCTNFAVTGTALDSSYFIPMLEQIGDSVLVVGDRATLKVHVHTNDPERATAIFAEHGLVSHVDNADMREQVVARAERLAAAAPESCGVLAVVSGEGMAEMFRSVGATPLDGGPTLNPSTNEILAGIHSVPAEQVIVLPNSPNVRMAAERAAELSDKEVRVVATRSQQAGLAAAVALDRSRSADLNAAAMVDVLERVRTGAVTEAARDDAEARFRAGQAIGFVDEELVAWGDAEETLRQVLASLAS